MFDDFLKTIREYAAARGIKPETVTFYATGDNTLVKRLENGGTCKPRVHDRVLEYIAKNPPPEAPEVAA